MPQTPLTVQFKEKPTYRVWCLHSFIRPCSSGRSSRKKIHTTLWLSRLEIHDLRQGAARPLYDVGGRPNATPDRLVQRCALHVLGQKAAHKGVPGPVGVHNPLGGQPLRREFQDLTAGLRIRIRIQSGQWIRIQEGKNDPQKQNFFLKVHVLKCWMASFESWRLLL